MNYGLKWLFVVALITYVIWIKIYFSSTLSFFESHDFIYSDQPKYYYILTYKYKKNYQLFFHIAYPWKSTIIFYIIWILRFFWIFLLVM